MTPLKTISALQVCHNMLSVLLVDCFFVTHVFIFIFATVLATGFTERGIENALRESVSLDQFNDVRQDQQYTPREPAPSPSPSQSSPPSYDSYDSPDKIPGFLKNLKKRR